MGVGLNFFNTSPGRPGQEIMNAVELKQWINGLNVGDKWVVANPSRLSVRSIVVLRKTPTQLVVSEDGVELLEDAGPGALRYPQEAEA